MKKVVANAETLLLDEATELAAMDSYSAIMDQLGNISSNGSYSREQMNDR